MLHFMKDLVTLGQRMRHFRTEAGLTLEQLGADVGVAGSQLSLMENGRREPRLSLLGAIAARLGIELAELLDDSAPTERAALEIELERAQSSPIYAQLGLPAVRAGKGMPDETLRALVGLHRELARRSREAIATPEEARRANTLLRARMRERDNHMAEIDDMVEEALRGVGHATGALTHRSVSLMAEQLGFELVYVGDLPHSARSVTDLANGRIYLPPASIPGGHGLRSMALQAIAHRMLGHEAPNDYAEFLQQRLEINYFAAAALMPRTQAVRFLQQAKSDKDIALEDFRDAFGVTHEAAALRFTNLATAHLDMRVHPRRGGLGDLEGVRERRPAAADGCHRIGRGRDRLPALERPAGLRAHQPHDGVLSIHRHTERHVLRVDADRHERRERRVLDHDRGAVRRREVLPRPGDHPPRAVTLPRRELLPPPARRPRRALAGQGVVERQGARAHLLAAAVGNLPGRRRSRALRVPRGPRIQLMRGASLVR
jgi:transcriptional regulator with XRE-family HTH domain